MTSVPSATAAKLAWSNKAPLGRPVVPLVHTSATGSCPPREGHAGGAAPPQAPCTSALVSRGTAGRPGGTPTSGSATNREGAVRSRIEATSPGAHARVDARGDRPQPGHGGVDTA